MSKITINGKTYAIEIDGMGLTYVNGMLVDEFIEMLPMKDIEWLAKYGMGVAQKEPEHFDDIAERIEMPHTVKNQLDKFKVPHIKKEDSKTREDSIKP